MSKKLFLPFSVLLALLIGCSAVYAQSEGIRCSGQVPDDLRRSMEELYMLDKQRVRDYTGGKLSNRDKVLTSSYYISRLMTSGRILYGDEISNMLDRIVDTLLVDYPDLRRELRIYTVKSSEVNAFATGQGMIFVNLGLVAQVEDESQLAFVLSHEIIHYVRKHNLEVLTRKRSSRDTTDRGLNDFLRYHNRSRQMESEADSLGIEMFYAKSPYDKRVTDGFFDVLQYGYLPFDEMVFDTNRFNTPYFKVAQGTFMDKVAPISAREDYNDSLSTHPNLLKRRVATTRQMASLQGGRRYVVTSEREFARLRTMARMECIRQDIITAEYASAYYNSDVMLKHQPDNAYLHLARAQAIYGASKFRTYAAASSTSDYRNKEGEIQQVYHFMRRCRPAELCMIAIRELWKEKQNYPQEERYAAMAEDLMADLKSKHNMSADMFSATFDTASTDETAVDTSSTKNTKYTNVRRRRRMQQTQESYRYVFTDIMERDASFATALRDAAQTKTEKKGTVSDKSTILFAPGYYVVNDRNDELNIRKSVAGESTLRDDFTVVNGELGLNTIDFSDDAMRSHTDAAFYNDFLTLCDWSNEYWKSNGKVKLIYSSQPIMNEMMKRYDADKLSLGTVVNLENTKSDLGPGYSLLFTLFGFPAPGIIYHNLVCHQQTLVHHTLVDLADGKVIANGETVNKSQTDSRAYVRSQTYAVVNEGVKPGKVPGYMGKRLIIEGLGGLCFPLLNRPFREQTDMFATRFGGGLEFVVGKQSSLSLAADRGTTTFDLLNEYLSDATITTFHLTYRHMFGDKVAPLGTYYGLGMALSNVALTPKDPSLSLRYLEPSYKRPSLQFEFGHNAIIKDWVVLNFGVRYNITLALPIEDMEADYGWTPDYSINAIRSMNANLWMYNLISLHLGIGLIPF